MIPKAVYDLPDLARSMGMTTPRARRYLEKQGVTVRCAGKGFTSTVLLIDLREAFPSLYASLEEAAYLRSVKA